MEVRKRLKVILMRSCAATSSCCGDVCSGVAQLCWSASHRWSNQQQRNLLIKEYNLYRKGEMIKKKNKRSFQRKDKGKVFLNLQNCVKIPFMIPNFPQTFIFHLRLKWMRFTWLIITQAHHMQNLRMFQVEFKTPSKEFGRRQKSGWVKGRHQQLPVRGADIIGDITKGWCSDFFFVFFLEHCLRKVMSRRWFLCVGWRVGDTVLTWAHSLTGYFKVSTHRSDNRNNDRTKAEVTSLGSGIFERARRSSSRKRQ